MNLFAYMVCPVKKEIISQKDLLVFSLYTNKTPYFLMHIDFSAPENHVFLATNMMKNFFNVYICVCLGYFLLFFFFQKIFYQSKIKGH